MCGRESVDGLPIELDPVAWCSRWNRVTVAPRDRPLQHRFHLRDVFDEYAVRNRCGHTDTQLRRNVRRHAQVSRGGEMTHLDRIRDAADPCDVRLENIQRAAADAFVKGRRTVQALAASPGNRRVPPEPHESVEV